MSQPLFFNYVLVHKLSSILTSEVIFTQVYSPQSS